MTIDKNTTHDPEEMISVTRARDILGVSDSTLRLMVNEKVIDHYRPGGRMIRFKRRDLDNWLENQKVKADERQSAQ